MNSLSWMIYAAEVINSLNTVLGVAFWLCLLAGIIFYSIGISNVGKSDRGAEFKRTGRRCLIGMAIATPMAIITPSSATVYLIAASEAGETIVTSPEAKEVFDDLKAVIKSKLKEQLPKASGGQQ